jgi:hypothetical protein
VTSARSAIAFKASRERPAFGYTKLLKALRNSEGYWQENTEEDDRRVLSIRTSVERTPYIVPGLGESLVPFLGAEVFSTRGRGVLPSAALVPLSPLGTRSDSFRVERPEVVSLRHKVHVEGPMTGQDHRGGAPDQLRLQSFSVVSLDDDRTRRIVGKKYSSTILDPETYSALTSFQTSVGHREILTRINPLYARLIVGEAPTIYHMSPEFAYPLRMTPGYRLAEAHLGREALLDLEAPTCLQRHFSDLFFPDSRPGDAPLDGEAGFGRQRVKLWLPQAAPKVAGHLISARTG